MKLASLSKRSWKPCVHKDTGKWFTGYSEYCYGDYTTKDQPHEVRTLTLTPKTISRGRSAANMIFEDKDGYAYLMSLGGGFELVKRLIKEDVDKDGEFLIADFVQTKKGSNIFIEAVDYD